VIGKTISHYKILEKIGEGGMGVVYKAEDTKLKRTVALKILHPELTRDSEARERFLLEARAAASLEHQNICSIYGIDEVENQIFIVMSYVDGLNLKEKIGSGPLKVNEALNITLQIAEGLAEAHDKGIIHRDIKSANIMIPGKGQVKILDFGLAKLKGKSGLTKVGNTLGTAFYMSPEQVLGKEVDHKTDIWSLGVVLYEMVTGHLPFKGEYDQSIMYTIMNEEPEPVTGLRTGIPMEFERILTKTLAKNPEERYQQIEGLEIDIISLRKKLEMGLLKDVTTDTGSKPSIAVLPFRDMSPQKDQDYFCEGIAEEIINSLTQIERIRVISRTSAFVFKDKNIDAREIGKRLEVDTLLEGSIRKAGNRLRITAQLIIVTDGSHLWSERFDREMEDIFAIQDEITLSVVDNLKIKLLGKEKENIVKHYTDDQEAHNSYLKGRYFWNRRHKVGYKMALEHFQEAIVKDPLFALAYVGIADTYGVRGLFGILPPRKAFTEAKAAAKKAIDIDQTLGEIHASLGFINFYYDWDWQKAEHEFKKALKINPSYAWAHEWYALFLVSMARFDEAIPKAKKALELNPLSIIMNAVAGCVYWIARRFDESIMHLKKAIELDPSFLLSYVWLGSGYAILGKRDEAIATLRKGIILAGDMPYALGFLGQGLAMTGQIAEAQAILDQMNQLSSKIYVSPIYKAIVYSGLGKMNKAIKHTTEAFELREPLLAMSKTMLQLDMRGDSRFLELLKKMGLER
jgi:serine/threonine protein kinase/tetratricopeptide (TPR) repeat protein